MKRPLFWPLLGLISGILLSRYFEFSPLFLGGGIACSLLVLSFSPWIKKSGWAVLSFFCLFLFLGNWISVKTLQKIEQSSNFQNTVGDDKVYWVGKILEPCQQSEEGGRFLVDLWEIKKGQETFPIQGKIYLKIAGEEACAFSPGDVLQGFSKFKTPEFYHNPYAFDYPFYLKIQGIEASTFVESKDHVVKRAEEISSWQKIFLDFRQRALQEIDLLTQEDSKQVLKTLLLGSSYRLDKNLQELFRKSGTTHLLVVSGLHLAMVMGFLYFLFRGLLSLYPPLLLRISVRDVSYWMALPCVFFYSFVVTMSPSVLRAMLSVFLLGFFLLRRRKLDPLSLLYVVAFIILFISPLILFDVSFQLSFLSIFSILLFLPLIRKYFETNFPSLLHKKILWFCVQVFLLSLLAQIGLFPLLVNTFHQVSWVTLLANLFLVPYFTFILMPLGMLGLFFAWIYPPVSFFFFKIAAACVPPVLIFLKYLTSPEGSTTWLPRMNAWQIILYASLFLVFLLPWKRKTKGIVLIVLILFNVAAWIYPSWKDARNPNLRISFLDVGQGDSILIEFPYGKKMLVDAGGLPGTDFDVGEKVLLPTLLGRGIRNLDYLVMTHPHPDHFGGMESLLKAYQPKEFWWNGEKTDNQSFENLFKALEQKKIPVLKKDESAQAFEINGVKLKFLNPPQNIFVPEKPDAALVNNHSLVFLLEDRGFSVLFSGDIQIETEQQLLNKLTSAVDLLKVAHHGSNTSSTEEFLARLQPQNAVMQLGRKNRFGFPRPEVLERYQKIGTKIYRTDQSGEIVFEWDGSKFKVLCWVGDCSSSQKLTPSPVVANPAVLYK